MIYYGNGIGCLTYFLCVVLAYVLTLTLVLVPIHPWAILLAGSAMTFVDIGLRATQGERHWFHSDHGGHVYYIPVWIVGLALVAFGVNWLNN